jgi:hypothetical protein
MVPAGSWELPLDPRTERLWFAPTLGRFIALDEKQAFALDTAGEASPEALPAPETGLAGVCNLPLPPDLFLECAEVGWRGFRFLTAEQYARAGDGDLLRTLVFNPDYGTYFEHPATGAIIALRGGSLELLRDTGTAFESVAKTKTRGRAALAFAAHPTEPLIAYGDNNGDFHLHEVGADGFGKARKLASKGRKASALEFIDGGETLLIGGFGYLGVYGREGAIYALRHEVTPAVRSFVWMEMDRVVVVNQGMHGISLYRLEDGRLEPCGSYKPPRPIDVLAAAIDLGSIAALEKYSSWPSPARAHLFDVG